MKKLFYLWMMFFIIWGSASADDSLYTNLIVDTIQWDAPSFIGEYYKTYFRTFRKKSFDPVEFKLKLDQVNKEIFTNGYFATELIPELVLNSTMKDHFKIIMHFKDAERVSFSFIGSTYFSNQELKIKLTEKIKNEFGKVEIEQIKKLISETYEELGVYGTGVEVRVFTGTDKWGGRVKNLYITIDEGDKIAIRKINFKGNVAISSEEIERLYFKNASSLALGKFYDKKYIENFSNQVKKLYLSRGFVFAEFSKPKVTYLEDDEIDVDYVINEKTKIELKKIEIAGLDQALQLNIKSQLENKENAALNIVAIEEDLKKIINLLQSNGYYFATIVNANSDQLIKYDLSTQNAEFLPIVNLDQKICFGEAIINGNTKTKSEVIQREIDLTSGELLTPSKLENIQQRLSSLNLFSSLRIAPYVVYGEETSKGCSKANVVLILKEKEFGLVEVTPGYRTDLGVKLATGIIYNNLGGLNRSLSFRTQVNQRLNSDGLDQARKAENKKLLEYSAKVTYSEPYLFYNLLKTQIEFENSSSWLRKRFSNLDADIFRISPQISKSFNRYISTSLKYQFERILQFNASTLQDNDNLSIGGLTPSLTLDFRDDPINTRKGYYFNISSEWANPYFGSMKQSNFEVNYVKVINRNKIYIPAGDIVLALSLALGYEQNYALGKFIPNIKVFRLDGYDEIRGFEDSEINHFSDGREVGKVPITKSAYFTAFKFEPRYRLTDSLVLNIFYDAGRVFYDHFIPLSLRSSVGLGLKFVTPVGSLDFDYGVKLTRKSFQDGQRDSMGRFQLSIGFF